MLIIAIAINVTSLHHCHQVSYLIVDPHYTGKDDLKAILSKGWVGWKSPGGVNKNR